MANFSRKEIEENSPSRLDGMDSKQESRLRRSYCEFLVEICTRFKFPATTTVGAVTLCHRFFLRQSHKNFDCRTIAAACMFVAAKANETVCTLKDVVVHSYDVIHKNDSDQVRSRIVHKGFYEEQKELILAAEKVVMGTIDYDFELPNPYPLLAAGITRSFRAGNRKIAYAVGLTLVNDALLLTSLMVQFELKHVVAGAIFLAADILKLEPVIPWQESEIERMNDVSKQLLELYDDRRDNKVGSAPKKTTVEASKPSGSCKRKADQALPEVRYSDRHHKRHVRDDREYDRRRCYDNREYDRRRCYDDREYDRDYDRRRRHHYRGNDFTRSRNHSSVYAV